MISDMPVQDGNWQDYGQYNLDPDCAVFQAFKDPEMDLLHKHKPSVLRDTLPVVLPISRTSVAKAVQQVRLCLAEVT